jgi:predicted DCC family thiol-disulfide oxidoreductase YuxK
MTARAPDQPVLLFDGVCNLCNAAVQFVIKRDPRSRFRFAALQSEVAQTMLRSIVSVAPRTDSMILIEGDRAYTRSTAALAISRRLRFPWPLLSVFWIIPRPIRDWMYDIIARNRYRWFGRRDECSLPTPELQARFL